MDLRVRPHPLDRRRVAVDAEQLNVLARAAQHPLCLQYRHRRQRTDRRALRVVEREQRDTTTVRAQRHRTAKLIGEREVRRTTVQRRARIEIGIGL